MATEEDRYRAVVEAHYEGVDQYLSDARKIARANNEVLESQISRGQGGFANLPGIRPQIASGSGVARAIGNFDPRTDVLTKEQSRAIAQGIAEDKAYATVLRENIETLKRAAKAGDADADALRENEEELRKTTQSIRRAQAVRGVGDAGRARLEAEEKVLAAERKLASTTEERARAQQRLSGGLGDFIPVTGASSSEEFAINRAKEADLAVANAENRFAALVQAQLAGEEVSEREVIAARKTLASSITAAAHADRGLGTARVRDLAAQDAAQYQSLTGLAKVRADLSRGFRGRTSDASYSEQIGQALKFSVFYGAAYKLLFALTQTFQQSLQEGILFEQGVTDMQIATGRSRDSLNKLANQLGATAAASGASPAAGLQIGANAIGLYGATQSSAAEQNRIALQSARTISELAVTTKQDPLQLQTTVAAVTRALGLGSTGQVRLADLDAFLTKRFGAAQGSTFQALESSANVGKQAGLSNEELVAIAADLIGRTGQTGSTVGGYLAQIFTRGGEGSLGQITGRYGINQNQSLKDQLRDLARIYAGASGNQRNEIAAVGGRGKSQDAFVALLQDYAPGGRIDKAVQAAKRGASGSLDEQFNERMRDVGGELQHLQGSLKELALTLGESGVLDAIGVMVKGLDELAQGATSVLQVFNEIPRPVRDTIIALAAFSLALKLAGKENILATGTSLLSRVGTGKGAAVTAEAEALFARGGIRAAGINSGVIGKLPQSATSVAERAALAEAGVVRTGVRGIGAAGKALFATVGPATLAIGGLLAIGAVKSGMDKLNRAADEGISQLNAGDRPRYGSTGDRYGSQADALQKAARDNRAAGNAFLQFITGGTANDRNEALAKSLDRTATELQRQGDDADRRAAAGQAQPRLLSGSALDNALGAIDTQGGTAASKLQLLEQQINGLGRAAEATAGKIRARELGADAVGSVTRGIRDETFKFNTGTDVAGGVNGSSVLSVGEEVGQTRTLAKKRIQQAIATQLDAKTLGQRTQKALDRLGITDINQLTPDIIAEVAPEIAKIKPSGDLKQLPAGAFKKVQDQATQNIADYLTDQYVDFQKAVRGAATLDPAQIVQYTSGILEQLGNTLQLHDESDFGGRQRQLQQALRTLLVERRTAVNSGADPAVVDRGIADVRKQLAASNIDRLEKLRKAAVSQAGSQAEATAIGRGFVVREIRQAIRSGSVDQLVAVLETADKGAIAIARANLQQALAVAKQAQAFNRSTQALAANVPALQGLADAQQPAGVGKIQKQLDALSLVTPDAGADQLSGGAAKVTAGDINAARVAANAQRTGGDVAAAKSAIVAARNDLAKAGDDQVAYYAALGSLYQAQNQLNQALAAAAVNRKRLASDLTDPVAQARLDLEAARAKLAADRKSGAGSEVLTQDKIDVKNAQNQAEAEKFNQRLSDAQTAESLGKISHQAYLQYLESEHNRLSSIKHKTRQQIDELNQIDGLIKDSQQSLSGQFNIGNIKLPTPYQIRRYVAETAQGLTSAAAQAQLASGPGRGSIHDTVIYINGADTGLVKKTIDDHVGKSVRVVTTAGRRNP